ncbi:MAG: hypothetical protein FJ319_07150 [SAR202 cluster bacterium]|nr:hypothetical protein [SAR202 cluster bacterium]
MIVRIMTEGQYMLPGSYIDRLNAIDDRIVDMVANNDRVKFQAELKKMLDLVRQKGRPVPWDELVESDIVLPHPDITIDEAKDLFVGDGLVPNSK